MNWTLTQHDVNPLCFFTAVKRQEHLFHGTLVMLYCCNVPLQLLPTINFAAVVSYQRANTSLDTAHIFHYSCMAFAFSCLCHVNIIFRQNSLWIYNNCIELNCNSPLCFVTICSHMAGKFFNTDGGTKIICMPFMTL